MTTIAAGRAKAQFLRLLKEVEMKRETVVVTKYGKPVARLMPMELAEAGDPLEVFRFPGKIEIVGDIMAPMHTDEDLDEFENELIETLK